MTLQIYVGFIITVIVGSFLSAAFTKRLIPKLKSKKLGQTILEIGPRWHKDKEGTPTMGGLAFIASELIMLALLGLVFALTGALDAMQLKKLAFTFAFALLNAGIGVIDDLTKFKNHRNEGLTAAQKYLLQLVVSGAYIAALACFCDFNTVMKLPFTDSGLELGFVYYIVALLLLTGIINSVNLTDGIDGLASSVTLVVAAALAFLAFRSGAYAGGLLCGALIGGCLGFLVYNIHPAKIFMGDTGSLFLGAMVSGIAFIIGEPLIILFIGIVYVIETLSVILQVTSFKLTGKRIFKMSPIHHHFEKCNWSEMKIVSVFSAVTAVVSVIVIILTEVCR